MLGISFKIMLSYAKAIYSYVKCSTAFQNVIGSLAVNPRFLLHKLFFPKTKFSLMSPELKVKLAYNLAYLWLGCKLFWSWTLRRLVEAIHHSCARLWDRPDVRFSNTRLIVDVGFCVFYSKLENITWFASSKMHIAPQSFAMFFSGAKREKTRRIIEW